MLFGAPFVFAVARNVDFCATARKVANLIQKVYVNRAKGLDCRDSNMDSSGSWDSVPIPTADDIKNNTLTAQIFSKCNSDACVQAQSGLASARNAITVACGNVAENRDVRNTAAITCAAAAAVAAALLTVAVTASATAVIPFFGWALAATAWLAFGIAAAVAAVLLVILIAAQIQLGVALGALNTAQTNFANLTDTVKTACPPQCWGDLTIPTCTS